MTKTTFLATSVIYFMIGLFLAVAGGAQGTGLANDIYDGFVNTSVSGNPVYSSELNATLPNVKEDSSPTRAFGAFVDSIKANVAYFSFLAGFVFAWPIMFMGMGFPIIILQTIVFPLGLMGILGLVMFARSGN